MLHRNTPVFRDPQVRKRDDGECNQDDGAAPSKSVDNGTGTGQEPHSDDQTLEAQKEVGVGWRPQSSGCGTSDVPSRSMMRSYLRNV